MGVYNMNDHKFCFIICTNNDLLLEESIHYINHLNIPAGYEIDLLTINEAASITQAYNEAMLATDAKYKIYMHQDVFILNRNILSDLLAIFQSDVQIGMIGMIGYDTVAHNGIMWYQKRIGNLYQRNPSSQYTTLSQYQYSLKNDGYDFVALIDGFFIATSHDLMWDTESITGWDFYDAFQCINFLEHKYKIAVPTQTHPWCMHDDGSILNMNHYNKYRHLFIEKYSQYLGKNYLEIAEM